MAGSLISPRRKISLGTNSPQGKISPASNSLTKEDIVRLERSTKEDIARLELSTKGDIARLAAEIEKRPTRRQTMIDVVMIVGLIGALFTLGTRLAH